MKRFSSLHRLSGVVTALAASASLCLRLAAAPAGVEHVLVIGCDGMGALAFGGGAANTPVMNRLMTDGAWTLKARGVMPTVSSPNWASIIMGAGPEQHGVTSNEWQTNKFGFEALERGPEGLFPTMFRAIREQRPAAVLACVHDWDGFGRLVEKSAVNYLVNVTNSPKTALHAAATIKRLHPTLTFVHFDEVDHAGHNHGWKSPEYFAAVHEVDALIGGLLTALDDVEMGKSTLVIVTADHGGKGKHHGGESMDELLIPWIARGPGVAHGRELASPVNTYDTAATVLYALGVEAPKVWVARPVREAFEQP